MTYEELINEINTKITTNGAGEITGAILNDVLKDIVATIKDDTNTVHVIISDEKTVCTFKWPFDDTAIADLFIDGYCSTSFSDAQKFPLVGMSLVTDGGLVATYSSHGWGGSLTALEKGKWYFFQYSNTTNANCSVYIRPNN